MFKRFYKATVGFSMIEMLIALLVLSVGLIGIAALQARGQQFNHSAYIRTQATFLAYDLMDRIRANDSSANNYALSQARAGTYVTANKPATLTTNCNTTVCTPNQLALYDLFSWYNLVQATLPEATTANTTITWLQTAAATATTPILGRYTITIQWGDARDTAAPLTSQTWVIQL